MKYLQDEITSYVGQPRPQGPECSCGHISTQLLVTYVSQSFALGLLSPTKNKFFGGLQKNVYFSVLVFFHFVR